MIEGDHNLYMILNGEHSLEFGKLGLIKLYSGFCQNVTSFRL